LRLRRGGQVGEDSQRLRREDLSGRRGLIKAEERRLAT
jgi:hypothetical protein